jgi:hypothetical protein
MPHRGGTILALGIIGLVSGFVCGFGFLLSPFAWIMGSQDLAAMAAGQMDSEGEGQTQAGRICGIVGTVFLILTVVAVILYVVFVVALLASLAGSSPRPARQF